MKCFLQSKALTAIYSYQLLGLNCGSGQHLARLSKLRSLCIQLHVSYFGLAAGHSVGKQKDPGTSLHALSHSKKIGLQTAQFGGIGRGGRGGIQTEAFTFQCLEHSWSNKTVSATCSSHNQSRGLHGCTNNSLKDILL